MNKKQEAKLNMYRATQSVCNENAPVFSGNAAFTAAFEEFETKIENIISTEQQNAVVITGIAADKNISKEVLCEKAAEIASVIYAYASTVGNNTLKNEVDFPYSKLIRLRDELTAPNCQNIHDKGEENLAALADYGITAQMLADLQEFINRYSADTPKPRSAISNRKTTTANLAALFEQTDQILKERMDKIVVVFRSANPAFVETYENARRIVDPATTTTQLKGKVTDKTTSDPIKTATVTAVRTENGSNGETFTAATDANGDYQIKPITHGKYTITITADGYAPLETDNFDIKLGEVNHLNAEMVT